MIRPDGGKLAEPSPSGWIGCGEVEIRAIILAAQLEVLIDVI
jgi:hypothetical protein